MHERMIVWKRPHSNRNAFAKHEAAYSVLVNSSGLTLSERVVTGLARPQHVVLLHGPHTWGITPADAKNPQAYQVSYPEGTEKRSATVFCKPFLQELGLTPGFYEGELTPELLVVQFPKVATEKR